MPSAKLKLPPGRVPRSTKPDSLLQSNAWSDGPHVGHGPVAAIWPDALIATGFRPLLKGVTAGPRSVTVNTCLAVILIFDVSSAIAPRTRQKTTRILPLIVVS